MRPFLSVTLEPGLERGVPWGRDLYTFVTSAAGHMMRTLQKPRKNRPSKRQVNHRRFLQNMIQRKFADIEAANHRLASSLCHEEEEKTTSSPTSQKPETADRSGIPAQGGDLPEPDKCSAHTEGISKSKSNMFTNIEISEKKQQDAGPLWKRHPKSQPTTCKAKKKNNSKERQKKDIPLSSSLLHMGSQQGIDYHHEEELLYSECYNGESQLESPNNSSEDSTQQDSGFIHFNQNTDISPSLSPLPLDSSCDFSIQMFTDISPQAQRSIADISESQWADIMDLFSVGSKDFGGCMDVEAYFESICACQGDSGQEVGADDVGLADQSDIFRSSEVEDEYGETGKYRYSYHGDQALPINNFQWSLQAQRQNEVADEKQFNNFKANQETNIAQLPTSTLIGYQYNASELQTYQRPQEENPCMLVNCENNQNFIPFEGIAQSFPVPLHIPEHRPIQTPPHEDDWLFTDILKDRRSPNC
ncbi:hypothetical protein CgunFtcFv8_019491 [Champsocephalus gunnari]|uniref:Uncharacterized protein n=1 Tax=Champsocephalus gunnari TaxID=52237 RepID=A0AAN8DHW7_CHAGU|nr:hypothetical protein CgunFtcFv8_019491 [Champsocephalus gunnari]